MAVRNLSLVLLSLLARASAFNLPGSPPPLNRKPAAAALSCSSAPVEGPVADSEEGAKSEEGAECLLDEPVAECYVRNQVDGPWADVWAKYVLLRPGMSYTELKHATLQRNQLEPGNRIPGTFRTVVIAHAICFLAALPAVLTSDAVRRTLHPAFCTCTTRFALCAPQVFPKLLGVATASRVASGI